LLHIEKKICCTVQNAILRISAYLHQLKGQNHATKQQPREVNNLLLAEDRLSCLIIIEFIPIIYR